MKFPMATKPVLWGAGKCGRCLSPCCKVWKSSGHWWWLWSNGDDMAWDKMMMMMMMVMMMTTRWWIHFFIFIHTPTNAPIWLIFLRIVPVESLTCFHDIADFQHYFPKWDWIPPPLSPGNLLSIRKLHFVPMLLLRINNGYMVLIFSTKLRGTKIQPRKLPLLN